MKQYLVYLMGGQVITVMARNLRVDRALNGIITNMHWTDADKEFKHLTAQHISAIVEV